MTSPHETGLPPVLKEAAMAYTVTAAHKAYDAYRAHCGGVSVTGQPLPTWDDQKPEIKEHWYAAVVAISDVKDVMVADIYAKVAEFHAMVEALKASPMGGMMTGGMPPTMQWPMNRRG